MKNWIRKHSVLTFFVISYVLMILSVFIYNSLHPGEPEKGYSFTWFLYAFSPTISALIVASAIGGKKEILNLLSGFTRWKVGFKWYLAALFLFLGPFVYGLFYIALGNPAPGMKAGTTIYIILSQLAFNLFSGPISEELGWRGFALPRLESKYNALVSSLILGVVWFGWHIPLYFVPGSAQRGIPPFVYLMLVIVLTIYITWLYNNTKGSLIITTLAHFSFNCAGGFIASTLGLLPPLILYIGAGSMLTLSVVLILIFFKPKNLSRKPETELPYQRNA